MTKKSECIYIFQLLRHSPDSPILFVGTVSEDIEEFSGNFFFSEYIETRVGLSEFELQRNGSVYFLRLSFGSLWVSVTMLRIFSSNIYSFLYLT